MRNAMKITGAVLALGILGSLTGCATMTPEQGEALAQGLANASAIYNVTQPAYGYNYAYTAPQPPPPPVSNGNTYEPITPMPHATPSYVETPAPTTQTTTFNINGTPVDCITYPNGMTSCQ